MQNTNPPELLAARRALLAKIYYILVKAAAAPATEKETNSKPNGEKNETKLVD